MHRNNFLRAGLCLNVLDIWLLGIFYTSFHTRGQQIVLHDIRTIGQQHICMQRMLEVQRQGLRPKCVTAVILSIKRRRGCQVARKLQR